jgi:hypothetical protein
MQDYDVAPLASAQVHGLAWSALPDAPVRTGFERPTAALAGFGSRFGCGIQLNFDGTEQARALAV